MDNKKLIKNCLETLESEDSPNMSELVNMVGKLCEALEESQRDVEMYEKICYPEQRR